VVVQTWVVDISAEDCEARMAASTLGRIGVIVDGRPEIFPVSHVYDVRTRSVAFPTNDRTKLQAALGWPSVAFEVDGLEPDGAGGWSVMVVGRAEEITDPEEVARLAAQRSAPWAAGATARWIRIVPTKTTGRLISAVAQSAAGGGQVARRHGEQEHRYGGRPEHVADHRGVTC
jgi:nitroimidazol reductase NimA-like FMN-containing flavoprotein (pyridoxamine 5'-phosphate oxidase superfamily)